jgi:hypothetical protein
MLSPNTLDVAVTLEPLQETRSITARIGHKDHLQDSSLARTFAM